MDLDLLKQSEDENEVIEVLEKQAIELIFKYSEMKKSQIYTNKINEFKENIITGLISIFKEKNFDIKKESSGEYKATYKSMIILIKIQESEIYIKINDDGHPFDIVESSNTLIKDNFKIYTHDNNIVYPKLYEEYKNDKQFLQEEIKKINESISLMQRKLENIDNVKFVAKFTRELGKKGEFSTAQEILDAI